MSSWGTRRQVSFILTFCLILLVIFGLIFVLNKKEPTCFDGEQNQDELGVDCGGTCLKVCAIESTDLIVHWSRVFRVRDGYYDLGVLIENPNPFGLLNVPMRVKVHDEKNILINDFEISTYLNPGEKTLVFEPNLNVGERTPMSAFVALPSKAELDWQRLRSARKPTLTVGGKRVSNELNGEVRITLTNDSLFGATDIDVYALVSDESGNVFAISGTHLDGLAVGEEDEIFFTWPENFLKNPDSVEIITRTDLTSDYLLQTPSR